MNFFQNSVLIKQLKAQDTNAIKAAYKEFAAYFHNPDIQQNIREAKEEQFQEGFLRELFVKVLGYTLNPSPAFNLTTEYKNVKDSKKADGAILLSAHLAKEHAPSPNAKVIAVIELKGTETTDLNRIEAQAFGYKNNQPDCVYVITSNFEKLRFYIDNAIEHIEFNLFTLTEKEFELLWLCLAFVNIEKNLAKRIKDESVSQEDVITKSLYNDYSLFKRELHQNLVALNPDHDPLTLFKKSQKLLDRFLFLFFAEDRQLLPPNSVRLILDDWRELLNRDVEIALYARFKKYFEYLNTGFKGKRYDVFAYNGGLFKTDELLDGLKIDDELLYRHTLKLSEYDFASEVDVNILGHIFENSLNELDEIKAQLEGQPVDKSKSKRKKDGVFYTPKYITKYIVDNTVGKLCTEKKAEIGLIEEEYINDRKRTNKTKQPLFDKLTAYRNWLLQLTICDPACGSGAFLNQALDFLINEHRYIDELQAKLFGDAIVLSDFEKNILENNLFGVDLNEESVEIAKLSLWLRTAQPNRKLNDLNNNIKCGNSLIDDPVVAGDKAFNWQDEFSSVFAKGGFDVVIGNPPYVVYIKSIFGEKVLESIIKKYDFAEYNPNTYALFTDLGLNFLLKHGGYLSYIFPNTWLEGQYFSRMRKGVYSKFVEEIVYLKDTVFQEVVETVILICKNVSVVIENLRISSNVIAGEYQTIQFDSAKFLGGYNPFITQDNPLLDKLETKYSSLGQGAIVYRGLETRDNEKWLSETKESDLYIPILLGRDVNRYNYSYSGTYVKFIKKEMKSNANIIMYQQPKILMRRTGATIIASLEKENLLALKNLYLIIPKNDNNIYSMMAQINSRLMNYYHKMKSSEENKAFAQFKGVYVESFPYVKSNNEEFQSYIEKIIEQTNALNKIQIQFTELLQTKYDIEKLTTKLQNWYELDAKDFLNELKKAKVQLSLSSEADWMQYFNQQKQIAQSLKSEIYKTDKEIDMMVYELYELTEEEIGIVEGK